MSNHASIFIKEFVIFKDGEVLVVVPFSASQGLNGQKCVEGPRNEQDAAEQNFLPRLRC